jgi:hypothetical protein
MSILYRKSIQNTQIYLYKGAHSFVESILPLPTAWLKGSTVAPHKHEMIETLYRKRIFQKMQVTHQFDASKEKDHKIQKCALFYKVIRNISHAIVLDAQKVDVVSLPSVCRVLQNKKDYLKIKEHKGYFYTTQKNIWHWICASCTNAI